MSAPIFISHSSKDQKVAQTICTALESRGLRCWISSRDVGPGENFQEAIVRAIRATKVMVLVFTENANNSAEIKKELALASRFSREVIPVRAEDVMPNDALAYEFSTRQWIDLFANWEHEIERLSSWIANFLVRSGAGETKSGDGRASEGRAEVSPGSESGLTGAGTAGEPPSRGFAQPSMPTEDKTRSIGRATIAIAAALTVVGIGRGTVVAQFSPSATYSLDDILIRVAMFAPAFVSVAAGLAVLRPWPKIALGLTGIGSIHDCGWILLWLYVELWGGGANPRAYPFFLPLPLYLTVFLGSFLYLFWRRSRPTAAIG